MDSENDIDPKHFYKVSLCSCPTFRGLVSLVPREAGEKAGLSCVMEANEFSFDIV